LQKRIQMKENKNIWLWGVFMVLLLITFFPMSDVGIVTGDDFGYSIWPTKNIFKDSITFARDTGRFYFQLTLWIYKIPYLIDSTLYFHFMMILPHISTVLLFVLFIKRIFKNETIGLLSGFIFCMFFQILGGHSTTVAYPFYFTFSFTLFLGSLHILLTYFETGKYKYLLISAFLFAIVTLFYESYLVFYLLVFILLIKRYHFNDFKNKKKLFRFLKEIFPFFIFGLTYIIIYFVYFKMYSTQYQGNSFSSDLNSAIFLKTMGNLTLFSLPLSSLLNYKFFLIEYSRQELQTINLFTLVFKQASLSAFIKGGLILLVIYWIGFKSDLKIKKSSFITITLISAFFIAIPHFPLALSKKYTTDIPTTYITTYFAYFGVVVLCLVLVLFLIKLLKKTKWIHFIILTFLGIGLFIGTVITQNINEKVCADLKVAENRITLMKFLFSENLIKQGAPVYLASLHESTSYFSNSITRQATPFSAFADQNGLKIKQYTEYNSFYNHNKDSICDVYIVSFSQAFKTGDAYFTLLHMKGNQLKPNTYENYGDSLCVGYLSAYKKFGVGIEGTSDSILKINDEPMLKTGTFFYQNVHFLRKPEVCQFYIKGGYLFPNTIMISNQLFPQLPIQKVGWYPVKYEQQWIKFISNKLERNKESTDLVKLKAKLNGITYDKALENDAIWILYNEYQ